MTRIRVRDNFSGFGWEDDDDWEEIRRHHKWARHYELSRPRVRKLRNKYAAAKLVLSVATAALVLWAAATRGLASGGWHEVFFPAAPDASLDPLVPVVAVFGLGIISQILCVATFELSLLFPPADDPAGPGENPKVAGRVVLIDLVSSGLAHAATLYTCLLSPAPGAEAALAAAALWFAAASAVAAAGVFFVVR